MFEYRKATFEDLEKIWNKDIAKHTGDSRWAKWKDEYIAYNKTGEAVTFVVVCDNEPIGQVTLLLSPHCKAIFNQPLLCDGCKTANFNAFRIEKQFEGQGHISKLVKMAEDYAKNLGLTQITIGVEKKEKRNQQIYFHWGYAEFVMQEFDEEDNGELVLYYKKKI